MDTIGTNFFVLYSKVPLSFVQGASLTVSVATVIKRKNMEDEKGGIRAVSTYRSKSGNCCLVNDDMLTDFNRGCD